MNNQPLITVAICTYNRADYLADTLDALAPQASDPSLCEILVIDNNSTDSTGSVCKDFAGKHTGLEFRYFKEESQGLSFARNRAVHEAAADSILFIDDDVVPDQHFIEAAAGYIERYPDVMCAGGRIFVSFDEADPGWIPKQLMPMFGLHDLGSEVMQYPKSNFPRGGNMMIRREVFDTCGMFDTELGRKAGHLLGSEEKAFFAKVREEGYSLYYWPEMQLHHRIGAKRLTNSYLKRQSEGIGRSERIRVQSSVLSTAVKLLSECIKLFGSLILSLGYLIRGKKRAAALLIRFRIWVLAGFLKPQDPV
ncbi:glycosyltransferase [Rhodohalobacter mucosus]|uniref:Glycosyltransferase 2-like domain-containing protein n=1 Tax=Rhodohalobacter mucosus TaxID=2079485 RepID=A0A316TQ50_9BACT|nr:glycosyltransferase [Rhodohalobacter mucosus]PWN05339.1 hypothetical protein DDZ15_14830 [Rhodohalobacter mucosus]